VCAVVTTVLGELALANAANAANAAAARPAALTILNVVLFVLTAPSDDTDTDGRPAPRAVAVMVRRSGAAMAGAGKMRRRAAVLATAALAMASGSFDTALALSATSRHVLAAHYLAIAQAGNSHLERDFDSLEGRDHGDLARAQADLRDAAATERLFDQRLLRIPFPPAIERVARALYRINQVRAQLTYGASFATALAFLHSYQPSLNAANVPVERFVRAIRSQLGLPPPDTS